MKQQLNYLFYATLLDAYQNYLSSDEIYQNYWGFSDNPEFTEDEFREKQRLSLFDRINRVSFDNEKADRGTAFNEVIDSIVLGKKSQRIGMKTYKQEGVICTAINNRLFEFPIPLCQEFSNYYKGAIPQVYTEAILKTKHGDVILYGYIDELMPTSVHDIKTTSKYSTGKFKDNWQHIVYPYCLCKNGNQVRDFEYNIAVLTDTRDGIKYETFTEYYAYAPEVDDLRLVRFVEEFIDFIEANRELITDNKIFNKHN